MIGLLLYGGQKGPNQILLAASLQMTQSPCRSSPILVRPEVLQVMFPISQYGYYQKTIKFKSPVTIEKAISVVEEFLSQRTYFTKNKDDNSSNSEDLTLTGTKVSSPPRISQYFIKKIST